MGLNAVWALRNCWRQVERLQVDNARSQGLVVAAESPAPSRVTRQSVHEKHAARRKAMGMEA